MRKVSRKKEPGPSSVKQGRARVPRMNFAQATLIGKWLLEANDVPKHVQSDEMEAFVQEMRRRFYELASDALDVVRYSLEVRKDGRLGHRILVAMGVARCAGDTHAIAARAKTIGKAALTPYEVADDGEDWQIKPAALGMGYASEDTEEYLGVSAPALGEHQRLQEVVRVADKTSGRIAEICMKDGLEENHVRQSAEPIVEAEDAPTSPSTALECLLPKL